MKKRMYYHKTDGGAEYLCSSPVEGTNEGSFDSAIIVRLDGEPELRLKQASDEEIKAELWEWFEALEGNGLTITDTEALTRVLDNADFDYVRELLG